MTLPLLDLEALVLRRALRVCAPAGPSGDGAAAARQFDAVLMSAGFKLSGELLAHLSALDSGTVIDLAVRLLPTVRNIVGDHVQHNAYFIDFPENVPDTLDFWARCLVEALLDPVAAQAVATTSPPGVLNLLALPSYGRYLHTYEDLLAAHGELLPSAGDRVTVLHLGGPVADEAQDLYLRLAASAIPLGDDDRDILRILAGHCHDAPQPENIPVRENRAIVNEARLSHGAAISVDTVTDVLRLACALSGGDPTLRQPTRFTSFTRPVRRALVAALNEVVEKSPAALGDVAVRREAWKRLGERLHPHQYPRWPYAQKVFAVARGELTAPSFAARVEAALATGDIPAATDILRNAPGTLVRSLDRLLRNATTPDQTSHVIDALKSVSGQTSGRVLLSLREHLNNRHEHPPSASKQPGGGRGEVGSREISRVFVNRSGAGRVVAGDRRSPLDATVIQEVCGVIDAEIQRRLPDVRRLVVDPAMLDVALPLTGNAAPGGFGVLPRGTVSRVEGGHLRFFTYWREAKVTTDHDLSALLLNEDFGDPAWVSWTQLTLPGAAHSGDITQAPEGASEFIDLDLGALPYPVVVPQVNVYSGEGFDDTAESFFGFMVREAEQEGMPFEPRTVRMKSDLRGSRRVSLPLVFLRGDDGTWTARWTHLQLRGFPNFNRVESNRVAVGTLMRAIVQRDYLRVRYLVDLWAGKGAEICDDVVEDADAYLGFERPDGLPATCTTYLPENLRDLVPE